MTKKETQQGVIDVLIRKGLMDETQIIELLELLGEDKFYNFIFIMSGQTLRIPNADRIWREYRNELIGRGRHAVVDDDVAKRRNPERYDK